MVALSLPAPLFWRRPRLTRVSRRPCELNAFCSHEGGQSSARLSDLSPGGVGLELATRLKCGQIVELHDGCHRLTARVAWCRKVWGGYQAGLACALSGTWLGYTARLHGAYSEV